MSDNDDYEDESIEDEENGDESITESESESENDDEGHRNLLNAINKFTNSSSKSATRTNSSLLKQNATENTFASDGKNISMDMLLGSLDGTKGFSSVKKRVDEFDSNKITPKFIEKTTSNRLERSIVYNKNAEDMSKWSELVSANRHAKTLDLANDKRQVVGCKSLVNKFQATTDLEKDIQMILISTGATEQAANIREIDELGERGLTIEEIRDKQAELSKVKARMFYDQMKNHRINKIKSKAFHRIKKRQRLKNEQDEIDILKETDTEAANELLEEKASKRIKERMDLKHKNTGKWAKMALQHGRGDKSLRYK